MPNKRLQTLLACAVLAATPSFAAASGSETWNGASPSSNNWSDAANWGGVPVGSQSLLTFSGNARLTPVNDLAPATRINGIDFTSGAGPFTLTGNSITLGDPNVAAFVTVSNSGTSSQTISIPIICRDPDFEGGSGLFNITSSITGAGSGGQAVFDTSRNTTAGVNTVSGIISDGPSASVTVTLFSNFVTVGAGAPWVFSAHNSYSGETQLYATLRADEGVGLPSNSHLLIEGGVLETGANFSRLLGATQGVQFSDEGGFSAFGSAAVTVTLGAPNSALIWGSFFFNPRLEIVLQTPNANQPITLQNSIDLHGTTSKLTPSPQTLDHIIEVDNSDSACPAIITGSIFDSVAAGNLIKDGPGWLLVNGSCAYGGNTTIAQGVLRANLFTAGNLKLAGILETGVNVSRALGTSAGKIQVTSTASGFSAFGPAAVTITLGASNSVLDVGGTNFAGIATLQTQLANQPLIFNNGLHFNSSANSASIAVNNANNSASATITGSIVFDNISAVFNKNGPGCLILGSANIFFFTNINQGTLKMGTSDAIAVGSTVSIAPGATLDLNGFTEQLVAINDSGIVTGTGLSNLNFVSSIDSTCSAQITGSLSVAQVGTNILEFTATNSYTGLTTLAGGILRADDGVGLPAASQLRLLGGILETGANLSRPLGNSPGNVELLSDVSGFSALGANAVTVTLGSALSVLTWGSTSFNPSTLVLQAASANQPLTLNNLIDLNGTDRTITVNNTDKNSPATVGGIVNTSAAAKLIKTGPGWLVLNAGGVNVNVQVSAGVLRADDGTTLLSSDIIALQGGVLESGTNISRTLGTTAGRISLPSGNSGFSAFGASPVTVTLGTALSTVSFGSATFSPSILILQSQSANQPLILNNGLNLSGTTRTISVQNTDPTASVTIAGALSDTVGSAGLIKVGNGWLILSSNSYSGQTTITQGVLRVATLPSGNLDLDGGILETPTSFTRSIGAGAGAIQFTGNAGFSAFGNAAVNITIGTANSVLSSGTPSFPGLSTLQAATANQSLTLHNGIHYAMPVFINTVSLAVKNADPNAAATITGPITFASPLTAFHKTGSGWLVLSSTANSFNSISIDGGVLRATLGLTLNADASLALAGGVFETNVSFTKTLGLASSNIRLPSGDSGFSTNATAGNITISLNSAGAAIAWNTANFNPSTLILQAASATRALTLNNAFNLAGATRTITVNNASSANSATITGAISDSIGGAGLTKTGPGRLVLTGAYTVTGPIGVNAGRLAFGNTAGTRQTPAVLAETSALSVSSTLDLGNRDLLIHSGATSAFESKIAAAYDFGSWDQAGITSSTAAASSGSTTLAIMSGDDYNNISPNSGSFDGKVVNSTDTVIKYTYAGDINMDGLVTFDDFAQFLTAYLSGGGSGPGNYAQGDMNYDGLVTFDDFALFLTNYLNQPTQPLGGITEILPPTPTSVPEPSSLTLLALTSLAVLTRRRLRPCRSPRHCACASGHNCHNCFGIFSRFS